MTDLEICWAEVLGKQYIIAVDSMGSQSRLGVVCILQHFIVGSVFSLRVTNLIFRSCVVSHSKS